MKTRNVLGAALGFVLVLTGIVVVIHHGPTYSARPGIPEDPAWAPVPAQPNTEAPPSPLLPAPDPIQIDAVARYAHTRAGGEKFALLVAQLITDTRSTDPDAHVLAEFESGRMSAPTREFLTFEARTQRQGRSERHYDTTVDMWIRSEPIGQPDAPRRVNVEVAGNVVSGPHEVRSWYRDRLDVVWESGRWQLVSYSGGILGPDSATNLTSVEQKSFLDGPGWRRIPAGSG